MQRWFWSKRVKDLPALWYKWGTFSQKREKGKYFWPHWLVRGLDCKRIEGSFPALWAQSLPLDKILICQWCRVCVSSEILIVSGRNRFLHYYLFNWREGAWLSDSAIFEPVETEKNMKPVRKLIIMQISIHYPFSHYLKCFLPSVGNKPASGRLPEEP